MLFRSFSLSIRDLEKYFPNYESSQFNSVDDLPSSLGSIRLSSWQKDLHPFKEFRPLGTWRNICPIMNFVISSQWTTFLHPWDLFALAFIGMILSSFVGMMYILLRNLIAFCWDNVHHYKKSYRLLFRQCTSF